MLTGDRASERDRASEKELGRLGGASDLLRRAGVDQESGVQVAVSGVPPAACGQARLAASLFAERQGFLQPVERDCKVLAHLAPALGCNSEADAARSWSPGDGLVMSAGEKRKE